MRHGLSPAFHTLLALGLLVGCGGGGGGGGTLGAGGADGGSGEVMGDASPDARGDGHATPGDGGPDARPDAVPIGDAHADGAPTGDADTRCHLDTDCPDPTFCAADGTCFPGCRQNPDNCGADQICDANHICVPNDHCLPAEICDNGLDDDCNGLIDQADEAGCGTPCVAGQDCDTGVPGECAHGQTACLDGPVGHTTCISVRDPQPTETCDGADNNCDGVVDDGFPRLGQPCESGQGACRVAGVYVCGPNGLAEVCGAVAGAPSVELCDGVDNDCDGVVDNGFAAAGAIGGACVAGVGACAVQGVRACTADGHGTECRGDVGQPAPEVCDGLDNDCDGEADEDFPDLNTGCGTGVGACEGVGIRVCDADGLVTRCNGVAGDPSPERCDGVDNDCDGLVDEDDNGNPLGDPCYSGPAGTEGRGACHAGHRACGQGHLGACVGEVVPTAEICDGLDNDCDGAVDLDAGGSPLLAACYSGPNGTRGLGLCHAGLAECVNGAPGPCVGEVVPANEICDRRDNDCDGRTDNVPGQACTCVEGQTRTCYSGARLSNGVGLCHGGNQLCLPDGSGWGPCDGEVLPVMEQCDGLDNNCNGEVDDSVLGVGMNCSVGLGACLRSSVAICDPDNGVICPVAAGDPVAELCDNVDNDCDGRTDEDFDVGLSCTRGLGACRRVGVTRCNAQQQPSCAAVAGNPTPEVCDQLDNDCDGIVDDGFNLGAACNAGQGECRRNGHLVCAENGGTACDAISGAPQPERCDGLDNDCDGAPDDGFNLGAVCTRGVGLCSENGSLICGADGLATCSVPGGFGHQETCNGLDDDCDGVADNDVPVGRPCDTGRPGVCGPGHVRCVSPNSVCTPDTAPSGEVCDGIDNDCNGTVDDGFGQTSCGLGVCRHTIDNCVGGHMQACDPMQGATAERCDGLDNNCDGLVDNDPSDVNIPCEAGLGECRRVGRVVCGGGRKSCTAVPGAARPELCDLLDNDCDGVTDNGALGANVPCFSGVGACKSQAPTVCDRGLITCPAVAGAPTAEVCDGVDNDCNGLIDEGFGSTVCGLGACRHAVSNCAGGPPPACNPMEGASPETCNGIDDDCDGVVDNNPAGLGQACVSGVGACARDGRTVCQAGQPACGANPGAPGVELCNLIDDDCDGTIDNQPADVGQPCSAGVGACQRQGATICQAGQVSCTAVPAAPSREICDEIDNNCDGNVDEGFNPVTCGVGICRHTVNNCLGGAVPPCDALEGARVEICNGLDDDCDGTVDNAPVNVGKACHVGLGACAQSGVTICRGGAETCGAVAGQPSAEQCDGLDNDCNGLVDEGGVCPDRTPPVVTVDLNVDVVNVGESVVITVTAADPSGVGAIEVLVNGASVQVDGNGQAVFTPNHPGTFQIVVSVTDAAGNVGLAGTALRVHDPADATAPDGTLGSPLDMTEIAVPTPFIGTVGDANFYEYRLYSGAAGDGTPAAWTLFARGDSPVTNGVLGTIDPTLMENGLYRILLVVEDANGNTTQDIRTVSVVGEAKVGLFTITYTDVTVPVAGMPLTVERTYDSRVKTQSDFGVGWSLSLKQGKFEHSRPMDQDWVVEAGGFLGLPCQSGGENAAHTTELRLGDRERYVFRPTITPNGAMLGACQVIMGYAPVYSSTPGTATLEIVGDPVGIYLNAGGTLMTSDFLDPYRIDAVRLTTPDGRVFDFSRNEQGIYHVEDRNQNSITIGAGGLINSTGESVTFERDGAGRIQAAVLPSGRRIRYGYGATGDLESVTDELGVVTRYRYDVRHNLVQIVDATGRTPVHQEYDVNGKLVAMVYPDGTRTVMDSDTAAREEVVRDRLGNVEVLDYDTTGNVIRKTDKLGRRWTYTYDANGRKLSETDPDGDATFIAYDAQGRQIRLTDALGNQTRYEYNAFNQLARTTDARGNVTTYTYDAKGNRLTETDPDGNVTTRTYDAKGLELTRTDALHRVWTYAYDGSGNKTREVDPSGREIVYTRDADFNILTETTTFTGVNGPEPISTRYTHDAKGRVVATTDPLGHVMRVEYDTRGNKSAEIDANGGRTTFDYDTLGNLVRRTSPDGTAESYTYDAENRRTSVTDRGGRATSTTFDALGRATQVLLPDGSTVSRTYDHRGNILTETDPRGNTTTYEYDGNNRKTAMIDALAQRTTYTWDENGNQTSVTGPDGEVWTYLYDRMNRRTGILRPDGIRKTFTYDAAGRKLSETDEAGNSTRFEYDVLNHLTAVTDALGNVTRYTYDELGNRTSSTDANGHATLQTWNALGRILTRELPNGEVEGLEYDAVGNIVRRVDFNGDEIHFTWDAANRLIDRTVPGGLNESEQATYTASGKRETVLDTWGVTRWTYDLLDRPTSRTDPDGVTARWAWDANGNRLSVTTPAGTTRYGYDVLNRLATVTAPDGSVSRYTFGPSGNRATLEQPGGVVTTYMYDRLRRLTQQTTVNAQGQTLADYRFTLGRTGNRTRVQEIHTGRTLDYTYDNLFRLTRETVTGGNPNRTVDYAYDAVGNRLFRNDSVAGRIVYLYDADDRVISANRVPYTYDDNGNLTAVGVGAGSVQYAYDTKGRMVGVTQDAGELAFHFDTDGNRVERFVTDPGGVTTSARYVIDDTGGLSQTVAELDENGAVARSYVYGADLLSERLGNTVAHVLLDGQMSVRQLLSAQAVVTDTYTYDAFGRELAHTGQSRNDLRFGGQFLEPNVGFYYMRARWLDPDAGRFTTRDPVDGLVNDPRTLHRYAYAASDPLDYQDNSGRFMAEVMVTMSIQSSLRSMYTTFLVKTLLNTLKVAYCLLKPAYETREQGMEMIFAGMEGGEQQMQLGQDQIAYAYMQISLGAAKIAIDIGWENIKKGISKMKETAELAEEKLIQEIVRVNGSGYSSYKALENLEWHRKVYEKDIDWMGHLESLWDVYKAWRESADNPQDMCKKAEFIATVGEKLLDFMPSF